MTIEFQRLRRGGGRSSPQACCANKIPGNGEPQAQPTWWTVVGPILGLASSAMESNQSASYCHLPDWTPLKRPDLASPMSSMATLKFVSNDFGAPTPVEDLLTRLLQSNPAEIGLITGDALPYERTGRRPPDGASFAHCAIYNAHSAHPRFARCVQKPAAGCCVQVWKLRHQDRAPRFRSRGGTVGIA